MSTKERLITLAELKHRTGLSRSCIYQHLKDKTPGFPVRIKVSDDAKSRSVRFAESQADAWIENRIGSCIGSSGSK